ncbi:MAG TPA: hypothetical protein VJ851_02040 [Jatrophihabitans sp.]|nr:hypothetical protein [Jatrophihabitans sp.]
MDADLEPITTALDKELDWTQCAIVTVDDLASAQLLNDLAAVIHDLGFVISCAERLLIELAKEDDGGDRIVVQALWSAALVAYNRCFSTGKRTGIRHDLVGDIGLQGEVKKFHDYLTSMRNKHIAHSVNPFEASTVGAILASDPPAVLGIATLWMRHIVTDRQGVEQLRGLALSLQHHAAKLADEQTALVQAEAEAIGAAELSRRPLIQLVAPGPDEVASGRST